MILLPPLALTMLLTVCAVLLVLIQAMHCSAVKQLLYAVPLHYCVACYAAPCTCPPYRLLLLRRTSVTH